MHGSIGHCPLPEAGQARKHNNQQGNTQNFLAEKNG
jgi:hypothetical protein